MREKNLNAEFITILSQIKQDPYNPHGKVDMKSGKWKKI